MYTTLIHRADLDASARAALLALAPGELQASAEGYVLRHARPLASQECEILRQQLVCDINTLPPGFDPEAVRLLITDMDSTLINIECVDEIADYLGVKAQ